MAVSITIQDSATTRTLTPIGEHEDISDWATRNGFGSGRGITWPDYFREALELVVQYGYKMTAKGLPTNQVARSKAFERDEIPTAIWVQQQLREAPSLSDETWDRVCRIIGVRRVPIEP